MQGKSEILSNLRTSPTLNKMDTAINPNNSTKCPLPSKQRQEGP